MQADLKTFAALGVYGASAITALTAQNTRGVRRSTIRRLELSARRSRRCSRTSHVAAIKIGMLGSAEIVEVVAERLPSRFRLPEEAAARSRCDAALRAFLVYDPVMIASSGDALSGGGFVEAIARQLLPLVDCLTPNLAEAAALLGRAACAKRSRHGAPGRALLKLGPRAVLMKGGHLEGERRSICW